jgi:hypothetical protein
VIRPVELRIADEWAAESLLRLQCAVHWRASAGDPPSTVTWVVFVRSDTDSDWRVVNTTESSMIDAVSGVIREAITLANRTQASSLHAARVTYYDREEYGRLD